MLTECSQKNACNLEYLVVIYLLLTDENSLSVVGVYDDEGPPVPIPNTVVKLIRAEDT